MEKKIERLSTSLEMLMVKMKEVDDRCAALTDNINTKELGLISFVGHSGTVIMKQIADFMTIPMSTATGIVDKLVAKRYIMRAHSEEDRRTVVIQLTALGQEAYQNYVDMKTDWSSRIITMLSPEESNLFIDLLEKISDHVDNLVPEQ